jgi:uncharacterized membrane protein
MRTTFPLAFIARPHVRRRFRRPLAFLPVGELVADKLPQIQDRIKPPSLLARTLSGAICAALIGRKRQRLPLALLGGGSAIAFSFLFFYVRKAATERLHVPGIVAGLTEDAVAIGLGQALA